MTHPPQAAALLDLSQIYTEEVAESYRDLEMLSGLHPDFIADAIEAIRAKKQRLNGPLLGEFFPHLVAKGLSIPDGERRRLAAAWLALYAFTTLVDYRLDQVGTLDARTSMSASALLGWGIGTISIFTAASPFSAVFNDNVKKAFAGQYCDLGHRSYGRKLVTG